MSQLKLTSQQKIDPSSQQNKHHAMQPVIADQETSGKEFWKRFMSEQKDFHKKIYLNENVEDFKKYFQGKYQLH